MNPLLRSSLSALLLAASANVAADAKPVLVIHGGAGVVRKDVTAEIERDVAAALRRAIAAGRAELVAGKPALDAVTAAIVVLEDDPNFNAARGAVFTHEGRNELDASLMDGATRRAGAIAGVRTVRNPILLARAVMEKSPHVMLTGEGAEAFAKSVGMTFVDPSYFRTERRWQQLQKALAADKAGAAQVDAGTVRYFGTVGAVALDRAGKLAAGTSTGGMTNKRWGRVGDSPIIGAGTWADAHCAVSATGWGEFYIRTAAAHSICARVALLGEPLAKAAEAVIDGEIPKLGGNGGAIALDRNGHIAMPFNTDGMFRAWLDPAGEIHVAIHADELADEG